MAISKQDVKHIAHLARIGITDEEIERFQKDLEAILGYVRELGELDTQGVGPMSHTTGAENVMREDGPTVDTSQEIRRTLVEMAPHTHKGYIKTKAIL